MRDLSRTLPLWINFAIFTGAASVVWFAGRRLSEDAERVAQRTGLSRAFLGMLLLGGATSLPELATTITATLNSNAQLATGNLFGGVALQMAILAIVDAFAVRGALTYFTPQPLLLFQGVMLVLLLGIAVAGIAATEPFSVVGVGFTPILLMLGYLLTLRVCQRDEYLPRWKATNPADAGDAPRQEIRDRDSSEGPLWGPIALAALAILAAGWALATAGDAISTQTGLGATFVGVVLVAASTSLPELSTSLGAVRHGNYQMAVSNILGTNCLEVALFFVADMTYRGGPILGEADASALFAASMGIVITCVFLVGLLERRDRTVFGMGFDSLAVLVTYFTGLVGLYYLR